jgi:molecular chaperone DnaK
MYQSGGDDAQAGAGDGTDAGDESAGPAEGDERVVDADFEEVDEDQKGKTA